MMGINGQHLVEPRRLRTTTKKQILYDIHLEAKHMDDKHLTFIGTRWNDANIMAKKYCRDFSFYKIVDITSVKEIELLKGV